MCISVVVADDEIRLSRCGHVFCQDCLAASIRADASGHGSPACPTCKVGKAAETGVSPDDLRSLHDLGRLTDRDMKLLASAEVRLATGEAVYHCINPACGHAYQLAPPRPENRDQNRFKVCCVACRTKQCAQCGVAWDDRHVERGAPDGAVPNDLTCAQVQAPVDEASMTAIRSIGGKPCPGECGFTLSKSTGCNVIRCTRCKIWVCALCGQKMQGEAQFEASRKHYHSDPASPCFQGQFRDLAPTTASTAST